MVSGFGIPADTSSLCGSESGGSHRSMPGRLCEVVQDIPLQRLCRCCCVKACLGEQIELYMTRNPWNSICRFAALVHTAERKEQLLAALQSLASDPHTAQSFTGETPMP